MSDRFAGKTCVVTGAGSGIGRELVRQLLAEGARVYALERRVETLESLAAEAGQGASLMTMHVDVSVAAEMERAASEIRGRSEQVDLLINNAGVTLLSTTAKVSFAQWRRVLDVNFMGVVHGIHCFYPEMARRGAGHIVNVASIAGSAGYATAQVYATSKAAVLGYTRSLRVEAAQHGVLLTTVCPSYVSSSIFTGEAVPHCPEDQVERTFLTPAQTPAEAARQILKGIRKRKKVVVFPLSGRFLYFTSRWLPFLLPSLQRQLLRRFEAIQA